MILEQYQLACLSLSSYLVGDETTGRAVVIDPQRDIDLYLDAAKEHNLRIEKVMLTHFHADYVSGHLELAQATGAEICYGELAEAEFEIRNLSDGERISLGDVTIEVMSTPGHTPESITFIVYEHADDEAPAAAFTGDTLFVGDVGRPDLLGAIGFTADELGSKLYDSLGRLKQLPPDTRVYPGHGAGSACGKQLGSDPFTTIGNELSSNYALQPMGKEEFVALVTADQPAAPAYFLHDAITNRSNHGTFDTERDLPSFDLDGANEAMGRGVVVVDTRHPDVFVKSHLPNAVNAPLDGRFAERAGAVVAGDAEILVAGDEGTGREAMVRLGRIGLDGVVGVIENYEAQLAADSAKAGSADRIAADAIPDADTVQLVDVRNPGETNEGTVPGAILIPLGALPARVEELDASRPVVLYCATGIRSSVAGSWLRSQGFTDVVDVVGGYEAWSQEVATAG